MYIDVLRYRSLPIDTMTRDASLRVFPLQFTILAGNERVVEFFNIENIINRLIARASSIQRKREKRDVVQICQETRCIVTNKYACRKTGSHVSFF